MAGGSMLGRLKFGHELTRCCVLDCWRVQRSRLCWGEFGLDWSCSRYLSDKKAYIESILRIVLEIVLCKCTSRRILHDGMELHQ